MGYVVCVFLVGPTDCIVEGEVLKLGGPFLQTWQKKHLKLYPNRLEFYHKSRDGQVVKGKGVEVKHMNNYFMRKKSYASYDKLNVEKQNVIA